MTEVSPLSFTYTDMLKPSNHLEVLLIVAFVSLPGVRMVDELKMIRLNIVVRSRFSFMSVSFRQDPMYHSSAIAQVSCPALKINVFTLSPTSANFFPSTQFQCSSPL